MKENLSESLQDYIEAIYKVLLEKPVCRITDIKDILNVTKASIVHAVSILKEKELINKERYGYITLTEKGNRIAKKYYKKYLIIKEFLMEFLNVNEEEANTIACGIEHHVNQSHIKKLENMINNAKKNPELLKNLTRVEKYDKIK